MTDKRFEERIALAREKAGTAAYAGQVSADDVDIEAFDHVGDPLAESVISTMREREITGNPLAAARRLEAERCSAAVEFFRDVEHVPDWVDFETMGAGAALALRYPEGLLFSMHGGLPLTYLDSGVARVMKGTGRLTTRDGDFERRFWETAEGFVGALDIDGMKPGGDRWNMWVQIRLLHSTIRLGILRRGLWERSGRMPIGQAATAAGAHIFGRYRVNMIRFLGGVVTEQEATGFELMWRWIARLQGANSELLGATVAEQLRIQKRIHAYLYSPSDESREVTAAMLDGFTRMRSFPIWMPRRIHAAVARRLLAPDIVETLHGFDVPGDLGLPADPIADVLVNVLFGGLRAINLPTRMRFVARFAERHGRRSIDRVLERAMGSRQLDFRAD